MTLLTLGPGTEARPPPRKVEKAEATLCGEEQDTEKGDLVPRSRKELENAYQGADIDSVYCLFCSLLAHSSHSILIC